VIFPKTEFLDNCSIKMLRFGEVLSFLLWAASCTCKYFCSPRATEGHVLGCPLFWCWKGADRMPLPTL